MTALPVHEGRAPELHLDRDALQRLPFYVRFRAYADFDAAVANWNLARLDRRNGGWQWRLDIRKAQRSWAHYKRAVRMARERISA